MNLKIIQKDGKSFSVDNVLDLRISNFNADDGELFYFKYDTKPEEPKSCIVQGAVTFELVDFDEERADIIGQNGNDGDHYEQD